MKKLWNVVLREPVLVLGLIQAVGVLLVAFGVDLTKAQTVAIGGVWTALSAILGRSLVSPVKGS